MACSRTVPTASLAGMVTMIAGLALVLSGVASPRWWEAWRKHQLQFRRGLWHCLSSGRRMKCDLPVWENGGLWRSIQCLHITALVVLFLACVIATLVCCTCTRDRRRGMRVTAAAASSTGGVVGVTGNIAYVVYAELYIRHLEGSFPYSWSFVLTWAGYIFSVFGGVLPFLSRRSTCEHTSYCMTLPCAVTSGNPAETFCHTRTGWMTQRDPTSIWCVENHKNFSFVKNRNHENSDHVKNRNHENSDHVKNRNHENSDHVKNRNHENSDHVKNRNHENSDHVKNRNHENSDHVKNRNHENSDHVKNRNHENSDHVKNCWGHENTSCVKTKNHHRTDFVKKKDYSSPGNHGFCTLVSPQPLILPVPSSPATTCEQKKNLDIGDQESEVHRSNDCFVKGQSILPANSQKVCGSYITMSPAVSANNQYTKVTVSRQKNKSAFLTHIHSDQDGALQTFVSGTTPTVRFSDTKLGRSPFRLEFSRPHFPDSKLHAARMLSLRIAPCRKTEHLKPHTLT